MTEYQPRRALKEDKPSTESAAGAATAVSQPTRRAANPPAVPPSPGGDYLSHRQILVVMGGLMAGMFLAALDQSIVAVALPMIIAKMMLEVKVQCLKSSRGMIGSLALDSTSTKSAAITTVLTSSQMPAADTQPLSGPAQLR